MERSRSMILKATVFAVVVMGASLAGPLSACESCQDVSFNPDYCFADEDGWTKCNDTGPHCVDEEIAGSESCDDEDDGGGGNSCPPECEPYDET